MRAKVSRLLRNVTKHRDTVVKKMRLSRHISILYTLYGVQHIHINLYTCMFYRHADADQN